jgi:Protein of unknown function (DUF3105)
MKSKRQAKKQQKKKKQVLNWVIWGGLAVVVLGVVGYVVFSRTQPAVGENVAVMADNSHVTEGTNPGPYSTDPPTSGPHYANEMNAGFYNEGDQQSPHPAGYLVHNLEHGYVIFWYNCSVVKDQDCANLKMSIKSVMDQANNFKVIAYPWPSIDVPVVMTSWGHIQKFANFDPKPAYDFVLGNRNKAPEPDAP